METAFYNKCCQVSEWTKKWLITVREYKKGRTWYAPQGVSYMVHDLQESFIHSLI